MKSHQIALLCHAGQCKLLLMTSFMQTFTFSYNFVHGKLTKSSGLTSLWCSKNCCASSMKGKEKGLKLARILLSQRALESESTKSLFPCIYVDWTLNAIQGRHLFYEFHLWQIIICRQKSWLKFDPKIISQNTQSRLGISLDQDDTLIYYSTKVASWKRHVNNSIV